MTYEVSNHPDVPEGTERRGWLRNAPYVVAVLSFALVAAVGFFVTGSDYWDGGMEALGRAPLERSSMQGLSGETQIHLQDLYERRVEFHFRGSNSLATNLKLQGIAVVLCVFLILRKSWKEEIHVANLAVRSDLLPLLAAVLTLALFYLWLEFGYLYLDLIDNRKIVGTLIQAMEGASIGFDSRYSRQHILTDQLFMLTPWLVVFEPRETSPLDFEIIAHRSIALIHLKLVGFCVFMGITHACMVAMLCELPRRLRIADGPRLITASLVVSGLVLALMAMIVLTHMDWRDGAKENWAQPLTFAIAAVVTALLWQRMFLYRGTEQVAG